MVDDDETPGERQGLETTVEQALMRGLLNSKTLDVSNADFTLFGGADKVTAPGVADAVGNVADSNVNIYGVAAFIETLEGYVEAGYAYIDAEDALAGQDYHSLTAAYTARYGG